MNALIKCLVCCLFLLAKLSFAQSLYIKTYGTPTSKPLIFLHGGPGYNAVSFEVSTAELLSKKGFYVILYDRRGEGRSEDLKAKFDFEEVFDDLNSIYKKFGFKKAVLMGHSFGGVLATLYADKYPDKINRLILVSTPIVIQETFNTIISSSKKIYKSKNDTINLRYINLLENMNKNSLSYSSYCFSHALQNGFYNVKSPTSEAMLLYKEMKANNEMITYGSKFTFNATKSFFINEHYTTLDLKPVIKSLLKKQLIIYGIYGQEDGLFSVTQLKGLADLIGKESLIYLPFASHNVFIDRREMFLLNLIKWTK